MITATVSQWRTRNIKVQPLSFQITRCCCSWKGDPATPKPSPGAEDHWPHPCWLMAPPTQPSPLFWCSKYTAGGCRGPRLGAAQCRAELESCKGAEVQDLSLPCVFSNSYTAPVLLSAPQRTLAQDQSRNGRQCTWKMSKAQFYQFIHVLSIISVDFSNLPFRMICCKSLLHRKRLFRTSCPSVTCALPLPCTLSPLQ